MKPIVVVGSVNIDFSIRVAALPRPHETILGGDLTTAPDSGPSLSDPPPLKIEDVSPVGQPTPVEQPTPVIEQPTPVTQ